VSAIGRMPALLREAPLGERVPVLPAPSEAQDIMADYRALGVSMGRHPLALLRPALPRRRIQPAEALGGIGHGSAVAVAGLVVARQRPATAGGIVFLLLEDETGTINVVIKPDLHERQRLLVRAEPLLVVEGVLERPPAAGGGISIVAGRLARLESREGTVGSVRDLFDRDPLPRQGQSNRAGNPSRAASGRAGR